MVKATSYVNYEFKMIPINQIEEDEHQPRQDFGTEGDTNRLFVSTKKLPFRPIEVATIDRNKYLLVDGHRRFICAKKLKLEKVPCLDHGRLNKAELEFVRYERQNNGRKWKPLERSNCLQRMKEANEFSTNKQLAKHIHLSETVVSRSLQQRKLKKSYLKLMKQYDLPEAYRNEFLKFQPKIRKIKNFDVDEIIENIFARVKHQVITNAKDFRKLSKIFLRAKANEQELHRFLSDPDMTVSELDQKTIQSGYYLRAEQLIQEISEKRQKGIAFPSHEENISLELGELIFKTFKKK